ncbi:MAG: LegC family aminotransferase [Elusimicrobia bacterium]|nr:LegC family aminotransferase [Elusimicrobiota bacterium]
MPKTAKPKAAPAAPTPIPLSSPAIRGNAWKYVKECLDTEWVSSVGRFVGLFEKSVAEFTGSPYAVAGVNGTACLHVALKLAGIGPGDGVIVPSLTFIATANAVSYCGAAPLFLDCDETRFNLDLDQLEDFLSRCKKGGSDLVTPSGVPVKAVMPVHVLGFPVDMDRLQAICEKHRLILIEDAAESIGSTWKGRHTGTFGKLGVLSFNGNKIITTGGGGMLLTADEELAKRARHVTQQAKSDAAEYLHDEIGYNYRMTNVCAALGLAQLEVLPEFLDQRRRISDWYRTELPKVRVEETGKDAVWNKWLMAAQVTTAEAKADLLRKLNEAGAQARPLWVPVPMQKPYRGAFSANIEKAKRAYDTVINIPSSTSMTEKDAARVAKVLREAPLERLLV